MRSATKIGNQCTRRSRSEQKAELENTEAGETYKEMIPIDHGMITNMSDLPIITWTLHSATALCREVSFRLNFT